MTQLTDHVSLRQRDAYRSMLLIRRFEERCLQLRREDAFAGSVHLCAGQEAVPVGTLAALEPQDRVVATYRGHGWALACGVPVDGLMAEICQRAGGINGGRAGSALFMSPEHGFLGENSIVGAGVPIAAGAAMAAQLAGTNRVVVVTIGDGATSQGATHEAIVFAAARRLPLVVICENNGWSEMTPFEDVVAGGDLARRTGGYGVPSMAVDGTDPIAVRDAVQVAADRARTGGGPTIIEAHCHRLFGHYNGDIQHYRPKENQDAAIAADPLTRLRDQLLSDGEMESDLEFLESEVGAVIDAASAAAMASPEPEPMTAHDHVYATGRTPAVTTDVGSTKPISYVRAVTAALRDELASRPEALVYGEDVGKAGGIFGATRGLQKEFGAERVFDTPITEAAILGSAVGAALEGMRPIVEIMWADFLLVALDQLINQAANIRYISRGLHGAPLVVRTQQGVTPGSCAQHSQSLEALLAHIPGLRVGLPSTPQDAYSMIRAAVASDDPCILFESRSLYLNKGDVVLNGPVEDVGGARLLRSGSDVSILTWGAITHDVMEAAQQLEEDGLNATVVDLRWLSPLDDEAIARAVAASGRILVVHEANLTGGFGAEVAARIAERHFRELHAPVRRLGAADTRFPASPVLQAALLPSVADIAEAATALVRTY